MGRYGHAVTVIRSCVQEILITIGGSGDDWDTDTLNECWVMNVRDNKYKKVLYIWYYDHLIIM